MAASYQFTPWHCLLGGVALGVVSAGKTLFSSRILGISGSIKGLLSCDFSTWRWLFLGGMAAGSAMVAAFMPGAIEVLPETFTVTRAAAGGLLVGLGAALGNGCTSGHGIAGNARLSVRSFVYTAVFMAAGAAAVYLTGTMEALQVPNVAPAYLPMGDVALSQGATLLGTATVATLGLGMLTDALKSRQLSLVYEVVSGVVFALGLAYTGMVRPSKVASFLAIAHTSWNASLAFVMGGALLVATPAMYFIKKRDTALDGSKLSLPSSSVIDLPLLLGGVLFGTGWGVCGMCPGPVLVSLAQPSPAVLAVFASMLVGLRVGDLLKPACTLPARPKSA